MMESWYVLEDVLGVLDVMEDVDGVPDDPMGDSCDNSPVNNNIKPGSILRVKSDGSLCDKTDEDLAPPDEGPAVLPKQSWLLRLFESTLFDPSMAMTYLFNSKVYIKLYFKRYFNNVFHHSRNQES